MATFQNISPLGCRSFSRMQFDQRLINPCSSPAVHVPQKWREESTNCIPLDLSFRVDSPAHCKRRKTSHSNLLSQTQLPGQWLEVDDDEPMDVIHSSSDEAEYFSTKASSNSAASALFDGDSAEMAADIEVLKDLRGESAEISIFLPESASSRTPSPTKHELSGNFSFPEIEENSDENEITDWVCSRKRLTMVDLLRLQEALLPRTSPST